MGHSMNESVTEVEDAIDRILAGAQEKLPATPVVEESASAHATFSGILTAALSVAVAHAAIHL